MQEAFIIIMTKPSLSGLMKKINSESSQCSKEQI